MTTDHQRMLRTAIDDVFGRDITVEYSTDKGKYPQHRARVTSTSSGPTDVVLSIGSTRLGAWISELDIGYVEIDEDGDDDATQASLRTSAIILRAFARGEGYVEYRPSLVRRRPRPFFIVHVDGMEYQLGRRTSRIGPSSSRSD